MKLPWQLVLALVVLAAGGTWYATTRIQRAEQAAVLAQLEARTQRTIAEFTQARLTVAQPDKDGLQGILDATRALHGELLAAVKLLVAARDTTVSHTTLPTETHRDSTRTATFRDSSFAGTISGTVTAPPCCQPLGISYRLAQPAFSPEIAFVRVGDSTVAVVRWQGQEARLESPYAKAPDVPLDGIHGFGAGYFDALHGTLEARGGLEIGLGKHWNLQAGAALASDSTGGRLFIGTTKSFNLFF